MNGICSESMTCRSDEYDQAVCTEVTLQKLRYVSYLRLHTKVAWVVQAVIKRSDLHRGGKWDLGDFRVQSERSASLCYINTGLDFKQKLNQF